MAAPASRQSAASDATPQDILLQWRASDADVRAFEAAVLSVGSVGGLYAFVYNKARGSASVTDRARVLAKHVLSIDEDDELRFQCAKNLAVALFNVCAAANERAINVNAFEEMRRAQEAAKRAAAVALADKARKKVSHIVRVIACVPPAAASYAATVLGVTSLRLATYVV